MRPETAALLARITRTAEDLHWTEAHLRRQRTILREQATALRLGVAPAVVVARLQEAKCWAVTAQTEQRASVEALAHSHHTDRRTTL